MTRRLALVLHAHLPWASRDPDDPGARWFHEVVVESLVPQLDLLERLETEGVDARVTLGITPPLLAMLADPLRLRDTRCYLRARREVVDRLRTFVPEGALASLEDEAARLRHVEAVAWGRWHGDLLPVVRRLVATGRLEPMASALTHPILPLLSPEWASVQVGLGYDATTRWLGTRPAAFWFPECAVDAAVAERVARTPATVAVVEPPAIGGRAGRTPGGLTLLARDAASAREVWDPADGFPAHPDYRERWRDAGFDAPRDLLAPLLPESEPRRRVGIGWHRISDSPDLARKAIHDPDAAARRGQEHAYRFVEARRRAPADTVAAFDAELFGHFWREGPGFLETVLRRVAQTPGLRTATLSELAAGPMPTVTPVAGSWGRDGDFSTWVCEETAWMQAALVEAASSSTVDPRAARELLLAQCSDWTFQVARRTAPEHGARRFRRHLERFHRLASGTRESPDDDGPEFPLPDPIRLAALLGDGRAGRPAPGHVRSDAGRS